MMKIPKVGICSECGAIVALENIPGRDTDFITVEITNTITVCTECSPTVVN